MNKVLNLLKKIYSIVKSWIVANGIEGISGFIIGLILLTFGYKFYSGIAFGVFACKNWDIVKCWYKGLKK